MVIAGTLIDIAPIDRVAEPGDSAESWFQRCAHITVQEDVSVSKP
jgi:hypothetical protein